MGNIKPVPSKIACLSFYTLMPTQIPISFFLGIHHIGMDLAMVQLREESQASVVRVILLNSGAKFTEVRALINAYIQNRDTDDQ